MKLEKITPDNIILKELGKRLSRVRKQRGFSQESLALEAGIGVATLRRIEDGCDGQISSWLKLLKALDMETIIDELLPENFNSPMAEVLKQQKKAGNLKTSNTQFVWGDEA